MAVGVGLGEAFAGVGVAVPSIVEVGARAGVASTGLGAGVGAPAGGAVVPAGGVPVLHASANAVAIAAADTTARRCASTDPA